MRRNSESFRNSGAYTSPGTPEYDNNNVGEMPKTWSSERVPLPTSSTSSRRYVSSTALIPFNSGRALPSKWDDAERWITSPISGYGTFKTSSIAQPQRRPKSKSGPLGPTGLVYLSNYSPTMPESGKMRNFMANSPLTTGVLVPDGLSVHYDAGKANSSLYDENNMMRCTSVPGLSDLLSETSGPSSQDDKLEGGEEEGVVSRVVSRRDMATQMSPEGSTHSSSKGRLSFSNLPSSVPTSVHTDGNHSTKDEIRDVQVDKGTTTARQSKKQGLRKMKDSGNVEELPATWNVNEASKNTSKLQREEAKITAWENLQNAKAEAAIRKLEMKLEKKRSASMDKITNKLRAAQMKSRDMRDSLSDRAPTTSQRRISCCMRVRIHSLGSCFSRHRN